VRCAAHGKYIAGLRQRLGSVPPVNGNRSSGCTAFQLVRLRRATARETLKQQFPHHDLVVSTITLTGQTSRATSFATRRERLLLSVSTGAGPFVAH
jgi:hypothetical protein